MQSYEYRRLSGEFPLDRRYGGQQGAARDGRPESEVIQSSRRSMPGRDTRVVGLTVVAGNSIRARRCAPGIRAVGEVDSARNGRKVIYPRSR
jgi:hypothetical protein